MGQELCQAPCQGTALILPNAVNSILSSYLYSSGTLEAARPGLEPRQPDPKTVFCP